MPGALPGLFIFLIAVHATAAEYATSGFLGETSGSCTSNELVFEGLGSQNIPQDASIGFEVGSGNIEWSCKGSRERTGCPGDTRFVTVTRGRGGSFTIRCYTYGIEVANALPLARPWAAVAINDAGRWGASIASEGPANAVQDALKQCGNGCRIIAQGPGRCVAVALSKAGRAMFGYSYGVDRNEVQSFAMKGCTDRASADTCRVKLVKCL